ncbi:hypothetical protein HHK36_022582 [Tetracentron sinense]|uniref:t-SNARE coiled-coil homology domain-containing protein n=1 Tax=Tetracentron sinense TaxID=13715 RepID=A0A834YQ45_TETSI|nr:hypothetical protein HHK36_022582 [Tetracentron sinense]
MHSPPVGIHQGIRGSLDVFPYNVQNETQIVYGMFTRLLSLGDLYASREHRSNRVALFDGIEEGGIRASSSYSSHEIDEHDNDRAIDGLQDRVILLKRLTGDIHEEVDNHNRVLDRMGNNMDASRGILSGTMDRFKMVFETKSSRRMFTLVASFVVIFLIIYYLTR